MVFYRSSQCRILNGPLAANINFQTARIFLVCRLNQGAKPGSWISPAARRRCQQGDPPRPLGNGGIRSQRSRNSGASPLGGAYRVVDTFSAAPRALRRGDLDLNLAAFADL